MSAPFRLVLRALACQHLAWVLGNYPSATFRRRSPGSEPPLLRHEAETVLDDVGDLLCAKGITDSEIKAFGWHLASLIDRINGPLHGQREVPTGTRKGYYNLSPVHVHGRVQRPGLADDAQARLRAIIYHYLALSTINHHYLLLSSIIWLLAY
jgi:hypothetical protein